MIRPIQEADKGRVKVLMRALWPDQDVSSDLDDTIFVWEEPDGRLGGFISAAVRPWVEGADAAPCPHIEGWYVEPDLRKRGIGRALVAAVEQWAREQGFQELTSDVEMESAGSLAAHQALGFEPTEQIQYFRKKL
ncbi:GNAT family N-acetyltransferase [Candidatus Parcubacteria bacterium]|nr:MAG: GNAT family N-acetyltransferase [Candidatus Parcubacteria bacterium]